eukprot:TRINITY_DN826_c3_g1_i1.p1 TRINITY_DN826_c3_g1~~TRINITY_DN826_c3_g1_i1.p1  ORF type:complete len:225 (+),score=46.55 TRINITY_DN826_c3_g1_i1:329-1003(+)
MEDPFDDIKEDVEINLKKCEKIAKKLTDEATSPTGEGCSKGFYEVVEMIKVDLKDLEVSIKVVEKTPERYGLTECEVEERVQWLIIMENKLHRIIESVDEKETTDGPFVDDDSPDEQENNADELLRQHFDKQRESNREQDVELRRLDAAVCRQKEIAVGIDEELTAQDKLLDGLGERIDATTAKLVKLSRKMDRLINETSDTKKMITIILLSLVLVALIILTFT